MGDEGASIGIGGIGKTGKIAEIENLALPFQLSKWSYRRLKEGVDLKIPFGARP
jgi:hypothetical protein